jgi:hypothetical protein
VVQEAPLLTSQYHYMAGCKGPEWTFRSWPPSHFEHDEPMNQPTKFLNAGAAESTVLAGRSRLGTLSDSFCSGPIVDICEVAIGSQLCKHICVHVHAPLAALWLWCCSGRSHQVLTSWRDRKPRIHGLAAYVVDLALLATAGVWARSQDAGTNLTTPARQTPLL